MTTLVWWRLCLAATAGYALAHGVHITGSLLMLKFGKVGVRPVLLFGSVWWMASHASAWLRLLLAIGLSAAAHKAACFVEKLLFVRAHLRKQARAEAREEHETRAARQESTDFFSSRLASKGGSEGSTSAMHSATAVGSCFSSDGLSSDCTRSVCSSAAMRSISEEAPDGSASASLTGGAVTQPGKERQREAKPPQWRAGEQTDEDEPTYVEAAAESLSGLPHPLPPSIRQRLGRNFTRQRLCMSLFALFGPVLHALFGEWDMIFSLGALPANVRVLTYTVSVYPSTLIAAAAFPVSATTTTAGRDFLVVPVVICSAMRCFGVGLDWYHTHTHINPACTYAHAIACALIFASHLSNVLRGLRGSVTWRRARRVHATEGVAFVACALVQRAAGPPPAYAPGNMSYAAALLRGALALALAMLVDPANRQRIARTANRAGLNDLIVRLDDLASWRPSSSPSNGKSAKERMKDLQELLDTTLISQEEYDQKRAEILASL